MLQQKNEINLEAKITNNTISFFVFGRGGLILLVVECTPQHHVLITEAPILTTVVQRIATGLSQEAQDTDLISSRNGRKQTNRCFPTLNPFTGAHGCSTTHLTEGDSMSRHVRQQPHRQLPMPASVTSTNAGSETDLVWLGGFGCHADQKLQHRLPLPGSFSHIHERIAADGIREDILCQHLGKDLSSHHPCTKTCCNSCCEAVDARNTPQHQHRGQSFHTCLPPGHNTSSNLNDGLEVCLTVLVFDSNINTQYP